MNRRSCTVDEATKPGHQCEEDTREMSSQEKEMMLFITFSTVQQFSSSWKVCARGLGLQ